MSEVWSAQTEREEQPAPAWIPFYESFDQLLDDITEAVCRRIEHDFNQQAYKEGHIR